MTSPKSSRPAISSISVVSTRRSDRLPARPDPPAAPKPAMANTAPPGALRAAPGCGLRRSDSQAGRFMPAPSCRGTLRRPRRGAAGRPFGDGIAEHLGAVRVIAEQVEAGARRREQHDARRAAPARQRQAPRRAGRPTASPARPCPPAPGRCAARPCRSARRRAACARTAAASGAKSWPLPSPPRMTTMRRAAPGTGAPRPCRAATVAPTLVPLLSSTKSTPPTRATSSVRCGSPAYAASARRAGASGTPAARTSASAASALSALCAPRTRSASPGISRWTAGAPASSAADTRAGAESRPPRRRRRGGGAASVHASQASPASCTRPNCPGACGASLPKLATPASPSGGASSSARVAGSSRLSTRNVAGPKMRRLLAR